jgi:hypothetical protein
MEELPSLLAIETAIVKETLRERIHPTPMEIQVATAKVSGIISACFRSATLSAVAEAINTLVWTLETANKTPGTRIDLICGCDVPGD